MIDARDKTNRFSTLLSLEGETRIDASELSAIARNRFREVFSESPNCTNTGFSAVGRRWTNEGGGDRDEREIEGREDTPGRQLRHREEGPRRADVQVHRQQASAQRVPALQSSQSYDQGKTVTAVIRCSTRVFAPPALCALRASHTPRLPLAVDAITP